VLPNLSFVMVNFAVRLSLALWIGGTVFLGALAAPIVFRRAPTRTIAGALTGEMVDGFAWVKLGAMIVIVAGAVIRFRYWEAWNGWVGARFALIAAACVLELVATFLVGPRILAARASIEEAGLDFDGDTEHPLRRRFRRLHGAAMGLQSVAALAAAGVLLMFF
jgi:hypothetical protein